jgi:hypothetical protein
MIAPRLFASLLTCLALVACGRQSPKSAPAGAAQTPTTYLPVLPTDSAAMSAVRFTQAFYDWYRTIDDADMVAVERRPELFGAQLLSALRADREGQHLCPGYICGLDWDPFTASQDPCDPYRTGRAQHHGDTIIVAVTAFGCSGPTEGRLPSVLAKLRQVDGRWQFVDFQEAGDSGGFSMLRQLAVLAADRAAHWPSSRR